MFYPASAQIFCNSFARWGSAIMLLVITVASFIFATGSLSAKSVSKQLVLDSVASCIVRMAPSKSAALMKLEANSEEETKFLQSLIDSQSSCFLKFSGFGMRNLHIRGAIAQHLLLQDKTRVARVEAMLPAKVRRALTKEKQDFLPSFAACIVQSDPPKSLALLRTIGRTPNEGEALSALEQILVNCIPENVEYSLNLPDLRSHIAKATYDLSEKNMPRETQ
jgi:hypothetical protein